MKKIKIFTYLLLMIALVWPNAAFARGLADDKVIFGGTYTLAEGETLDGKEQKELKILETLADITGIKLEGILDEYLEK